MPAFIEQSPRRGVELRWWIGPLCYAVVGGFWALMLLCFMARQS